MALVEIDDIELGAPHPGKIQAFSIDAPCIGGRNVYDVEFAGWVIGNAQPVQEIEIHQGGAVIRRAPLDQQRPDVVRDYPNSPGSGTSGFRTWVSVIGLEPGADLGVLVEVDELDLGPADAATVALETCLEPPGAHRHGGELLGIQAEKPNRAFHGASDNTNSRGYARSP